MTNTQEPTTRVNLSTIEPYTVIYTVLRKSSRSGSSGVYDFLLLRTSHMAGQPSTVSVSADVSDLLGLRYEPSYGGVRVAHPDVTVAALSAKLGRPLLWEPL